MKKWLLGLGMLMALSAMPAGAQSLAAGPYLCIDQTSFYCYNMPATMGIGGAYVSGHMTLDIFSGGVGYVSFASSDYTTYFYAEITLYQVTSFTTATSPGAGISPGLPLTQIVSFSSSNCYTAANPACAISGSLDLSNVWEKFSSGGGRGSHGYIYRPYVTVTGSYVND